MVGVGVNGGDVGVCVTIVGVITGVKVMSAAVPKGDMVSTPAGSVGLDEQAERKATSAIETKTRYKRLLISDIGFLQFIAGSSPFPGVHELFRHTFDLRFSTNWITMIIYAMIIPDSHKRSVLITAQPIVTIRALFSSGDKGAGTCIPVSEFIC